MLEKNYKLLLKQKTLQEAIDRLEKNKIHILYFSYYINFHNLYHWPLLITSKILALITGKVAIDHVNHISRFVYDKETKSHQAKVFEATLERGMEQNDLFDKLKVFQGICYIETIDKKVLKTKARVFEKNYTGIPYSKNLAALSGIDLKIVDKHIKPKNDGGFCSWLVALFLKNQNIKIDHIQGGNPYEITPIDLFQAELGKKSILFQS